MFIDLHRCSFKTIIPAKHPNSLVGNTLEFMENLLGTHTEAIQKQNIFHSELIDNVPSFDTRPQWELIQIPFRIH